MRELRNVAAAQASLMVAGGVAYGWWSRTPPPTKAPLTVERAISSATCIANSARIPLVCSNDKNATSMPAPCCRLMDVHGPSADGTLRFTLVSREFTRKATQFRNTGVCTLAFHDPRAAGENGYVSLSGGLRELRSASEKHAAWKSTWSYFHRDPERDPCVLVWEFTPERVELVDHSQCLSGIWRPVTLTRTGVAAPASLSPEIGAAKTLDVSPAYWKLDFGVAQGRSF